MELHDNTVNIQLLLLMVTLVVFLVQPTGFGTYYQLILGTTFLISILVIEYIDYTRLDDTQKRHREKLRFNQLTLFSIFFLGHAVMLIIFPDSPPLSISLAWGTIVGMISGILV